MLTKVIFLAMVTILVTIRTWKKPWQKPSVCAFRKQRKAYFSRYPVPADLRAVLGKDYLTTQIGLGSASEVERQHRRNLSDFDKQIEEARLKLSVSGSSDSSHARLRESYRLRQNSLNMRLAKLPMVDSISEYRLADMIEGWFEEWFSQRKSDLLQMIQHHMEEKSIGVNDGIVSDYIASLVAELEALGGKGVSYGAEPPHVTEAKRICLDAGVYLKPDGKCFRKLVRILLDILGETYRWELECIAAGEDCFFYPKALENLLSRLTSADSPPSAPAAVRSITIIELFEQYKAYLRPRGITEKSLEEYDVPMRLMTEFLGNAAIHTLTFDDFEHIREYFMQTARP